MFQWVPVAFVRIVLFFIAGILIGIYQPGILNEFIAGIILVALVVSYFILVLWSKINPGPVGLLAVLVAGYLNLLVHTQARHPDHFMHTVTPVEFYKAELAEPAEEKASSWKQVARVKAVRSSTGEWTPARGNVLLYFSKNDFAEPFSYGTTLLINGAPQPLTPPANPGEFDYKRFLGFRNIYHQHFIRNNSVMLHDTTGGNVFFKEVYVIRNKALQIINTCINGTQQQAIAAALILGVKDGLDTDLTQAYAASGAMHVLAVSGLHVGIIYMIILFVLQPTSRSRQGKWALAFVSIVLLWGYASITGFSPSVLRAVTMFSFVALARPLNYRTNIYNILAVSAFVLLLFNPYLVMSVGFQLSYLAVIGIVYLQPVLYRAWIPKSILLDKVWQITCVSLAAQLATFALGLLYFHQFPVYFLFSNLFVIPGATLILITGIALLAISWIPVAAKVFGVVLSALIKTLNFLVFTTERLPFSIIENVYITTLQCWLLIFIVVSGILLLQYRKFQFLITATLFALLFGIAQWYHYYTLIKPAKLVVYHVPGFSAMELIQNGRSGFYGDPSLISNTERMRFHISPNRLISGVYHTEVNDSANAIQLTPHTLAVFWQNNVIIRLQKSTTLPESLHADYILISNNAIKSASEIAHIQAKAVILDSSNSLALCKQLLNEAKSRSLPFYSVMHSGAFVNQVTP
ncbi:MAG: ComEC family competence protein [Flammeovirgaceae bacterium]|nr:MAG: ComEC family competence protein [Flammeovirgaceae bacterium]